MSIAAQVRMWLTAVLVALVLSPINMVSAGTGHLRVMAVLEGRDVSEQAQIVIMRSDGMPGAMMRKGQVKTVDLAPGTYNIMAMLKMEGVAALPARKEVEVVGGAEQTVIMEINTMPGLGDLSALLGQLPGAVEPAEIPQAKRSSAAAPATMEKLAMDLSGADPGLRLEAAFELAKRGKEAATYAASLVDHENPSVRADAFYALAEMGSAARGAIPVERLPAALEDSYWRVRVNAGMVMLHAGDITVEAVQRLLPALEDPVGEVRAVAAAVLGVARGSARREVQAVAVDSLLHMALHDPYYKSRWSALTALNQLGAGGDQVISGLGRALQDPDIHVRRVAVRSLGRAPGDVGPIAPILMSALLDIDHDVRHHAAGVVGRRVGSDAVPQVIDLLSHKSTGIRLTALEALRRMRAGAEASAPALGGALSDPDEGVRRVAMETLVALGPGARGAAAPLTAALLDPDRRMRSLAASALGNLDSETAARAVPGLTAALDDEDRGVRVQAARSLRAAGPAAHSAIPSLIGMLSADHPDLQNVAAQTLGQFGPVAGAAVDGLIVLIQGEDRRSRDAALSAALALGSIGEAAVPALMELLKTGSVPAKIRAAAALGAAGPAAGAAVPKLSAIAMDKSANLELRRTAAGALERITGERLKL